MQVAKGFKRFCNVSARDPALDKVKASHPLLILGIGFILSTSPLLAVPQAWAEDANMEAMPPTSMAHATLSSSEIGDAPASPSQDTASMPETLTASPAPSDAPDSSMPAPEVPTPEVSTPKMAPAPSLAHATLSPDEAAAAQSVSQTASDQSAPALTASSQPKHKSSAKKSAKAQKIQSTPVPDLTEDVATQKSIEAPVPASNTDAPPAAAVANTPDIAPATSDATTPPDTPTTTPATDASSNAIATAPETASPSTDTTPPTADMPAPAADATTTTATPAADIAALDASSKDSASIADPASPKPTLPLTAMHGTKDHPAKTGKLDTSAADAAAAAAVAAAAATNTSPPTSMAHATLTPEEAANFPIEQSKPIPDPTLTPALPAVIEEATKTQQPAPTPDTTALPPDGVKPPNPDIAGENAPAVAEAAKADVPTVTTADGLKVQKETEQQLDQPLQPSPVGNGTGIDPNVAQAWSDKLEVLERENVALRDKLHLTENDKLSDIKVDAVTQIRENVLRTRVRELEKELDKLHMQDDPANNPDLTKAAKDAIPPPPPAGKAGGAPAAGGGVSMFGR